MHKYKNKLRALEILKYIGPGLLVTVGFIDPGNWASNLAAGADYGTALLWVITLSTLMLIIFQHNVAHLGIVTGKCLAESIKIHFPKWIALPILGSATLAVISTMVAEILGGAIALQILFKIPLIIGSIICIIVSIFLLFSNTYKKTERIIVGFVSVIGFAFLYELLLLKIEWIQVIHDSLWVSVPDVNAIFVIMALLGAIIMPHNLFLHSEIIQSRQWNLESEAMIKRQLKYEFLDTSVSMIIGWLINSSMVVLAAYTFYINQEQVTALDQAAHLLTPLLGSQASTIFAIALLFSGIASIITAMMTSGTITASFFFEAYDEKDPHTKYGIIACMLAAFVVILFVNQPYLALLISQIVLSIQLPITIISQIVLTSSSTVMKEYKNKLSTTILLVFLGSIIIGLNIWLLISFFIG